MIKQIISFKYSIILLSYGALIILYRKFIFGFSLIYWSKAVLMKVNITGTYKFDNKHSESIFEIIKLFYPFNKC